MTFAVLGRCSLRGQSGVAITTSSQNITDPRLGPSILNNLLVGLAAGLTAGGEEDSIHSPALLVAGDQGWPIINLRVDWTEGDPIAELDASWQACVPQMNDYVTRVLDPDAASSYGVPRDE